MQDIKINGKGNFAGGEFGVVSINGMGQCDGDMQAERLDIDGKFKCTGTLKAGKLDCDGMAEFKGNVSAQRIDIDGMMRVSDGKLEAEEIDCDGSVKVDGQISADKLKVDGLIHAEEIVGDTIVIKSCMNRFAAMIMKGASKVGLIEATNIELNGVQAETVNGSNIKIGPGCRIENLDCDGQLRVHDSAEIQNITGNYTRL